MFDLIRSVRPVLARPDPKMIPIAKALRVPLRDDPGAPHRGINGLRDRHAATALLPKQGGRRFESGLPLDLMEK